MKKLLTTILSVFMMVSLVGVNVFAASSDSTYTTKSATAKRDADVDELTFGNTDGSVIPDATVYYGVTGESTITIKNDTDTDYGYVVVLSNYSTDAKDADNNSIAGVRMKNNAETPEVDDYNRNKGILLSDDNITVSADFQTVTEKDGIITLIEPSTVVKAGDSTSFKVTVTGSGNTRIMVYRFKATYKADKSFDKFVPYSSNPSTGYVSTVKDGTIWYKTNLKDSSNTTHTLYWEAGDPVATHTYGILNKSEGTKQPKNIVEGEVYYLFDTDGYLTAKVYYKGTGANQVWYTTDSDCGANVTVSSVANFSAYDYKVNAGDITGTKPTTVKNLTVEADLGNDKLKAQQLIKAGTVETVVSSNENAGTMIYNVTSTNGTKTAFPTVYNASGTRVDINSFSADADLYDAYGNKAWKLYVSKYAETNTYYSYYLVNTSTKNIWEGTYNSTKGTWSAIWTSDVTYVTGSAADTYTVNWMVSNIYVNNKKEVKITNYQWYSPSEYLTVKITATALTVTAKTGLKLGDDKVLVDVKGELLHAAYGNVEAVYDTNYYIDWYLYDSTFGTAVLEGRYYGDGSGTLPKADSLSAAGTYYFKYITNGNYSVVNPVGENTGVVTITIAKYNCIVDNDVKLLAKADTTYYGFDAFEEALDYDFFAADAEDMYDYYKDVDFDDLDGNDYYGLISGSDPLFAVDAEDSTNTNAGLVLTESLYNALLVKDAEVGTSHSFTIAMTDDFAVDMAWALAVEDEDPTVLTSKSVNVTWALTDVDENPIVAVTQKVTVGYKAGPVTFAKEAAFKQLTFKKDTSTNAINSKITVKYSLTEDGEYTSAIPTLTNVGTYTVYYEASATGHNTVKGKFTVVISTGWVKEYVAAASGYRWFYMNSDGTYATGWFKSAAGKWYYLATNNEVTSGVAYVKGQMLTDIVIGLKANGHYVATKPARGMTDDQLSYEKLVDGDYTKVYYLTSAGYMATDWYGSNSYGWIYANKDGSLRENGWIKGAAGEWYYINNYWMVADNTMKIDGVTYFFNKQGAMVKGWYNQGTTVDPDWIYCDANGAAHTGWVKSGANWYYVSGGRMLTSTWVGSYWVDANGVWTETM